MLNTFRKIPPRITAWYMLVFGPLAWLQRVLFGTTYGLLAFSLAMYWYMAVFGDSKPFNLSQLLLWFDDIPIESKTGIATTLITVVGFVVAFRTASLNWKEQTRITLRIAAADEIERFYDEVATKITAVQLYADRIVEEVGLVHKANMNPAASRYLSLLMEDAASFRATRTRLAELTVEVHRLAGKNYSLLAPIGGIIKGLEDCADALGEVTNQMWVTVPTIPPNHPYPEQSFVGQIDLQKWRDFAACCERNYDFINGLVGGIRGLLLAPLSELTTSSLSIALGRRDKLAEAMADKRHRG